MIYRPCCGLIILPSREHLSDSKKAETKFVLADFFVVSCRKCWGRYTHYQFWDGMAELERGKSDFEERKHLNLGPQVTR